MGPWKHETEQFLGTKGQHIQDDDCFRKIESGVADVQCPQQTGPQRELVSQPLTACERTISPVPHVFHRAAG